MLHKTGKQYQYQHRHLSRFFSRKVLHLYRGTTVLHGTSRGRPSSSIITITITITVNILLAPAERPCPVSRRKSALLAFAVKLCWLNGHRGGSHWGFVGINPVLFFTISRIPSSAFMYRAAALLCRHRGKDLRLPRLAKFDCGGTAWDLAMSNMGASMNREQQCPVARNRGTEVSKGVGIKKMECAECTGGISYRRLKESSPCSAAPPGNQRCVRMGNAPPSRGERRGRHNAGCTSCKQL